MLVSFMACQKTVAMLMYELLLLEKKNLLIIYSCGRGGEELLFAVIEFTRSDWALERSLKVERKTTSNSSFVEIIKQTVTEISKIEGELVKSLAE
jgi:hypothetical protein